VIFSDPLVSIHHSSTLSSGPVFVLENSAIISEGALALGERSRLSPGSGIPVFKQTLSYYQRDKRERGARMKDSLLLEAVESFSALQVQYHSKPVAGFVA
jgi:hypothetical protein